MTKFADEYKIDIAYPGSGVGGSGNLDYIVLPPHAENILMPKAITTAVNSTHHQFVDIDPEKGIVPKMVYNTDVSLIDMDTLKKYNSSVSANRAAILTSPPDYGLSYKIEYDIAEGVVLLKIEGVVNRKGTRSDKWFQYKGYYDHTYFSKPIRDLIRQSLSAAAKQMKH